MHPKKKLSRGCLRVRPDANADAKADADADADANRSKTICRPPLKVGRHNNNELLFYECLCYSLRLFSEGNMTLEGIWEVQSRIFQRFLYLSESERRGLILIDCDIDLKG